MKNAFHNALRATLAVLSPVRLVVVAVILAVFYFLVLGDQGLNHLRRLVGMKHRLLTERSELNEKIEGLTRERDTLSKPDNLEMIVRSELGYIKPGEVVFEEKKPAPQ